MRLLMDHHCSVIRLLTGHRCFFDMHVAPFPFTNCQRATAMHPQKYTCSAFRYAHPPDAVSVPPPHTSVNRYRLLADFPATAR